MNRLPKDAAMLVSVLNTRLRDIYPSLDALCEDTEADKAELEERCRMIGYSYDSARNQFV